MTNNNRAIKLLFFEASSALVNWDSSCRFFSVQNNFNFNFFFSSFCFLCVGDGNNISSDLPPSEINNKSINIMPCWKSANSSDSSPISRSPPSSSSSSLSSFPASSYAAALTPFSPRRHRGKDQGLIFNRNEAGQLRPRLTRLRKLRHLTDQDLGDLDSSSAGINSTPVSRSGSRLERAPVPTRSASSALLSPQPLPRPGESAPTSPRLDVERRPLPSPKEPERSGTGSVHAEVEECNSEEGESKVESRLTPSTIRKSFEQLSVPRGSSNTVSKNRLQDSKATETANFWPNFPDKHMPASAFPNFMLTPGRLIAGDYLPSAYASYQIPQIWSAPEITTSDMITAFSPHRSAEKVFTSPDHAPFYATPLISPGPRSKYPSATLPALQSKMFPDNSPGRHESTNNPNIQSKTSPDNYSCSGWAENNGSINVHPLPLPPGAPLMFQPASSTQFVKSDLSLGTGSLTSQWQKGKLIGSGTFGNVFIATNRNTGALCAMKEVNLIPDDPKSAECIKQLQQEIKLLGQLRHQNIVQYYGSEVIEDRFYIYLEYVYPGSINKYVQEHFGAITESVVSCFTRHILRGLAYLHSKKTIHRDIKGANLLVNSCGVIKLADFGMAKHLSEAKDALSMKGTPYWMAPEVLQATMNKQISYDFAVDIWSLGCTIIEMFTGKHPWCGFESAAAMFKVLQESPQIPESLSSEGRDFLQCCFRRNPAERPTASKLLEHPFVSNTQKSDFHVPLHAFEGIKLSDFSPSPRNNINLKSNSNVKAKYSSNDYGGVSPA